MLKFADLQIVPERFSLRQIQAICVAAVVVLIGRLLAISTSPWDWDEVLFSSALREYDVAQHLPHPPGFPLFVALAKIVNFFVASEFRSVQTVTVAGAIALFPVMLFLGRELRLPFGTNLIAALLLVHLPNVWFFGGGAFSDVPSLTLVLLACALLLQGCRSRNAYLAGALVLGIAAGVRSQNLLVGLAPALLATWCRIRVTRSFAQPLLAMVIGAATVAAAYGGAAAATGDWDRYQRAVAAHRDYITTIDSFRAPGRPALWDVFQRFFVRPYYAGARNDAITALALIGLLWGLVRRNGAVLMSLAMFLPFAIAGWLMLDNLSASRFSVAWSPFFAITAACAIVLLARQLARALRVSHASSTLAGIGAAWLIVELILWTMPALNQVRQNDSPPAQAIQWIRTHVPPGTRLDVRASMWPFARFYLGDYQIISSDDSAPVEGGGGWLFQEGVVRADGARTFSYRRNNLWKLARRRYFEVSVAPQRSSVHFGQGWYDEESSHSHGWRWMSGRSTALLAPAEGEAKLRLRIHVPLHEMPSPPTITITLNGTTLESLVPQGAEFTREYAVKARGDAPNELVIETTRVLNPRRQGINDDARDLGLRLDALAWMPPE